MTLKEILRFPYVTVSEDGHVLFDIGDMITDRQAAEFIMSKAVEYLQEQGYSCITPITYIEDHKGYGYFTRPINSFYAFNDPEGEVARVHLPQQGRSFRIRSRGGGRPASRDPRSYKRIP